MKYVICSILLLFTVAYAQADLEHVSLEHVSFAQHIASPNSYYFFNNRYVFSDDSSMLATIRDSRVHIFDTRTQEWLMTFEPPIPLCSSGKFVDNYFFLRCVHRVYQWDIAQQQFVGEHSLLETGWYASPYYGHRITQGNGKVIRGYIEEINLEHNLIVSHHLASAEPAGQLDVFLLGEAEPLFSVEHLLDLNRHLFVKDTLFSAYDNQLSYRTFPEGIEQVIATFPSHESYRDYDVTVNHDATVVLGKYSARAEQPDAFILHEVATKQTRQWFGAAKKADGYHSDNYPFYSLSADGAYIFLRYEKELAAIPISAFFAHPDILPAALEPVWRYSAALPIREVTSYQGHVAIRNAEGISLWEIGADAPKLSFPNISYQLSPNLRFGIFFYDDKVVYRDFEAGVSLEQDYVVIESAPWGDKQWEGRAEQKNSALSWGISVWFNSEAFTIGNTVAYVRYQDYPCTSRLTLRQQQDTIFHFDEELVTGQNICVDGGRVRLELLDKDTMLWQFFRPDSDDFSVDSEGLLRTIEW